MLAPPFDASKRAALCGALEDYLESSNAGDVTMRAMLPVAVGGAGMSWADLMGVLRTLSDAARRGSSSGVAAPPPQQQQNITVRVDGGGGATITAGLPDEDRVEAQSIGQDVSDVASTPSLMNELRALGNMASSASPSASLAAAVDGAGEPIRRMLRTTLTEHLERLMAHNSYSGETMQTVHTVRNALARRQWSSVHGASSEPNAEEKKIMRACVAGCLGKARPALFMTSMLPDGTSVGASSATDPLGFLEKVPAAEAALGLAVLLTVAHLQVAFPAQAAQTMRFYVALLKWVRSQRAQQASWAVLSEWWAGLFRHIDQRFVALMTRRASSLPPLDPKCLTEPTTEYNMRYTHARAMELARSAAAKVEAEGQNALSKAIAAAVKEQTKNLRSGGGGKRPEVPIVVGAGGDYIDAVMEVRRMLEMDPTPEGRGAVTPMFRKPDGCAFTTDDIRDVVRQVAFAVGEDPLEFGAHSLRIGGATALFAAGADPIHIRTMGRWSSDCYRLYVRACFEQTMDWTRKLGSQQVHDVQGTYARSAQEVELY